MIARLVNGPADGDLMEIPAAWPEIRIPERAEAASYATWTSERVSPEPSGYRVHAYRLALDPAERHDRRGRLLYWWHRVD